MKGYPWLGEVVRVEADLSWSYYRCGVCRQPLTAPDSVARGYGPDCLDSHGREVCERRRDQARGLDRLDYAGWLQLRRTLANPAAVAFQGPFVVDPETGEILRPRLGSEWDR